MSRSDDQLVLDAIAGRRPNGKNQIRANCPFCEMVVFKVDRKQCLTFSAATGFWKCFRCDSKGKVNDLPFDVGSLQVERSSAEAPPVNLPEGFIPLWTPEGRASIAAAPARKYLASRGVSQATVQQARIGACVRGTFAQRVVVPIYKAGKLAGYVGRAWKKKAELKYRYNSGFDRASTLYNEEALYATSDEPAIIVEGVFDTFPFWPNGVAVLGKPSGPQVDMMIAARRPILVVFDGDAHRDATALAMMLRLHGKTAAALRLPPGVDPDECVDHVKEKAREAFA